MIQLSSRGCPSLKELLLLAGLILNKPIVVKVGEIQHLTITTKT
jgi:hypothetical protein